MQVVRGDHNELKRSHETLKDELPRTYARREDVKDGFDRMERQLARIFEKLDERSPPH